MLLKVIACVIAFLLALVLAILFTSLRVRVLYDKSLKVYAHFGLFKFRLYPKKEKQKNERQKPHSKKDSQIESIFVSGADKNAQRSQKGIESKNDNQENTLDTLKLIYETVKSLADMLGKSGKIQIRALKVSVSRPDAGDTAIQFGICHGAISGIIALTSLFGKSKICEKNIEVTPDFLSGKSKIYADIEIGAKTVFVLKSLIFTFISNSSTKQNRKDGEKQ